MKYQTIKHLKEHQISVDEISSIIAQSILEENYLNFNDLQIKIKALIKSYRIQMFHHDFNKIPKPNEYQNMHMRIFELEKQRYFFREKLKKHIDKTEFDLYETEIDNQIQSYKQS
jgi:hypothetical protein